jgi:hypothetical protein
LRFVFLGVLFSCALAVLVAVSAARAGMSTGRTEPSSSRQDRRPQPTYRVTAGLNGDIFPAFANYSSMQSPNERTWPTVTVRVSNSTDELLQERIAVRVAGWSDQEIQMAELGAGQVRDYKFAPSFWPRFYHNRQLVAATAVVTVTDSSGKVAFSTTAPLRLRSAEDMYWGKGFQYADFIASWVTPHDGRVEAVLARAKEFMPGRRLPGYETDKPCSGRDYRT